MVRARSVAVRPAVKSETQAAVRRRSGWRPIHRASRALAPLFATLALAGCMTGPPSPSETAVPTRQEDIELACINTPFPPERLNALPGSAEHEPDAAAAALRAALSSNENLSRFPRAGWLRVVQTANDVEFVAPDQDTWDVLGFRLGAAGWDLYHSGECRLHPLLPPDVVAGDWWIAIGASLDPTARVVAAMVSERGCPVGPARPDRIGAPLIAHRATDVKIVVPVRIPGSDPDCAVGPTPISIDIGEPIGSRLLLDGGNFPPRDARVRP